MEAVRTRVKDIDFQMKQLTFRSGKGDKDRFTTFPATLTPLLQNHLARVKTLHQQDAAQGHGEVYLPHALARKYPNTAKEWGLAQHVLCFALWAQAPRFSPGETVAILSFQPPSVPSIRARV